MAATPTTPGPNGARYAWPGGAKLAVYLGVNLEHFAFGEGLGAELAPGGPQPDVMNLPGGTTATGSAAGG